MASDLTLAACHAMGTRFEIALWGGTDEHLRAAAREALDEIERLHRQLSVFDPASDIWDINARAAHEPVRVEPRVFALLERCVRLTDATHGAFDITIGPLMEQWGFRSSGPVESSARAAPPDERERTDRIVGADLILLDPEALTVRFRQPNVRVDLGAIAKGCALDAAADILKESRIGGGLIHGGTSSIVAIGASPDGRPWRVGIRDPADPEGRAVVAFVEMHDRALGVSAPHGRMAGGQGHVMDPRTGRPAAGASVAAVACGSAAEADAFSTALLVLGRPFAEELRSMGCETWLIEASDQRR